MTLFAILFLVTLNLPSCLDLKNGKNAQGFEVVLNTGVPGLGRLGETYNQVIENTNIAYVKITPEQEPIMKKLNFTEGLYFPSIGANLFFRRLALAMIVAQEPFNGYIVGIDVKIFLFSTPPVSNWEAFLLKQLGVPDSRASGGRFGSEILFYNWGDLSYNRMGANELALYRDIEIQKFRLTNFGRQVQFFPKSNF